MNWYYYKKDNEKIGPFTAEVLKELAAQGRITPETIIENESDRTAIVGKVGLEFPKTTRLPLAEVEELTTPPPPAELNPFTVSLPTEPNPFTATLTLTNPFVIPEVTPMWPPDTFEPVNTKTKFPPKPIIIGAIALITVGTYLPYEIYIQSCGDL